MLFGRKKKNRVEQAREDLEKQIKVVNKQAKQTRKDIVKRLNNTADDLRSGLDSAFSREEQKEANKIAHDLETIARDVEERAEKGLHDVAETAKENAWGIVVITLLIGVIVGVILKNLMD